MILCERGGGESIRHAIISHPFLPVQPQTTGASLLVLGQGSCCLEVNLAELAYYWTGGGHVGVITLNLCENNKVRLKNHGLLAIRILTFRAKM
jgi:hypothetical protein